MTHLAHDAGKGVGGGEARVRAGRGGGEGGGGGRSRCGLDRGRVGHKGRGDETRSGGGRGREARARRADALLLRGSAGTRGARGCRRSGRGRVLGCRCRGGSGRLRSQRRLVLLARRSLGSSAERAVDALLPRLDGCPLKQVVGEGQHAALRHGLREPGRADDGNRIPHLAELRRVGAAPGARRRASGIRGGREDGAHRGSCKGRVPSAWWRRRAGLRGCESPGR